MRTFRLLNQEQANKEAIPSQTCFSPCISGTCPPARTLLLGEHRFQPRLETTDRTPGPQPLLRSCDKVHQQNKYFSFNRWRKHGSLAASPEEFAFSLWAVSHTFKDLLASPTLRRSGSWDVGCFLFLLFLEILMFLVYITFKVCFLKLWNDSSWHNSEKWENPGKGKEESKNQLQLQNIKVYIVFSSLFLQTTTRRSF